MNYQLRLSRRTAAAACASAMISLPRLRAACACALRAHTRSTLRRAFKSIIMDIHEFSWSSMSHPFDQYIYIYIAAVTEMNLLKLYPFLFFQK